MHIFYSVSTLYLFCTPSLQSAVSIIFYTDWFGGCSIVVPAVLEISQLLTPHFNTILEHETKQSCAMSHVTGLIQCSQCLLGVHVINNIHNSHQKYVLRCILLLRISSKLILFSIFRSQLPRPTVAYFTEKRSQNENTLSNNKIRQFLTSCLLVFRVVVHQNIASVFR